MTEPTHEEKVKTMILANRIMDSMFEEIRPVLQDYVATKRELAAAYGIRLPQQEETAERQRLLEVLAEARQKREGK